MKEQLKKRIVGFVSLCGLIIAYLVFRYPMIGWHGMYEFPFVLLIAGIVAVVISGIIIGNKIAPVFTTAGYVVGFFAGYFFNTDSYDPGGGLLNNMWIIWMFLFIGAIFAGVIIEIIIGIADRCKKRKHEAQ
ncbi:MAG: hypothetical protein J1F03_05450 [Oscillospiraceae bacterium]|nr:hypothetical protein [Oscillospiraceae bacterium]